MHKEGFEPSSVATSHLECDSLDRSDICAQYYNIPPFIFIQSFHLNLLTILISMPTIQLIVLIVMSLPVHWKEIK